MLALIAVGAGKTVSEDAAFEIAAKGALDIGGRRLVELSGRAFQPGFEVRLDGAIPQRPLGTAALITPGAWRGTFDRTFELGLDTKNSG
jgi:hypothetical protein